MHESIEIRAQLQKIEAVVYRRCPTPGARNILAPQPTKVTEFEVKNRWKDAEEAKIEHLLKLFCSFSIVIIRIY